MPLFITQAILFLALIGVVQGKPGLCWLFGKCGYGYVYPSYGYPSYDFGFYGKREAEPAPVADDGADSYVPDFRSGSGSDFGSGDR